MSFLIRSGVIGSPFLTLLSALNQSNFSPSTCAQIQVLTSRRGFDPQSSLGGMHGREGDSLSKTQITPYPKNQTPPSIKSTYVHRIDSGWCTLNNTCLTQGILSYRRRLLSSHCPVSLQLVGAYATMTASEWSQKLYQKIPTNSVLLIWRWIVNTYNRPIIYS